MFSNPTEKVGFFIFLKTIDNSNNIVYTMCKINQRKFNNEKEIENFLNSDLMFRQCFVINESFF